MTPVRRNSLIVAALAVLGLGGLAVAQIEGNDRGVPPIDSSANYEVGNVAVDVTAKTADQARTAWQITVDRLRSLGVPDAEARSIGEQVAGALVVGR